MPRLLQVIELGHPTLRTRAEDISSIASVTTQDLIDDLLYTCAEMDGVGIAAPQVNVPSRIFIMASKPNSRYPKAPFMEPIALINPQILALSDETNKDWEGCLSFPGVRARVSRPTWVDVKYFDRYGHEIGTRFKDFLARVFLHEHDHLEGTMFSD